MRDNGYLIETMEGKNLESCQLEEVLCLGEIRLKTASFKFTLEKIFFSSSKV